MVGPLQVLQDEIVRKGSFNLIHQGSGIKIDIVLDKETEFYLVFNSLTFGPYFKVFAFSGKTFDKVGAQTVLGVNLNFSKIWKPKYQKDFF